MKKQTECTKCLQLISNCNIKKHSAACDGNYKPFVKATNCPWCNISFTDFVKKNSTPTHIRWCLQNPLRDGYIQAISHRGKTNNRTMSEESKANQANGVKQAHLDGKYIEAHLAQRGKSRIPHTQETKNVLREKALASPHRRLCRSIREYIKKDGTIVKLDSSWEEALAKRLDAIDVEWTRPPPIKWVDGNNVYHNYFPDFYLVDYDVYLDPKNPYAIKSQQDKLTCLEIQIPNLIIIKSLSECNNFVPSIKI